MPLKSVSVKQKLYYVLLFIMFSMLKCTLLIWTVEIPVYYMDTACVKNKRNFSLSVFLKQLIQLILKMKNTFFYLVNLCTVQTCTAEKLQF